MDVPDDIESLIKTLQDKNSKYLEKNADYDKLYEDHNKSLQVRDRFVN